MITGPYTPAARRHRLDVLLLRVVAIVTVIAYCLPVQP